MKVTDKELRATAGGARVIWSTQGAAMAAELLALRAERKRLRGALTDVRWCIEECQYEDALNLIAQSLTAARKPRKK